MSIREMVEQLNSTDVLTAEGVAGVEEMREVIKADLDVIYDRVNKVIKSLPVAVSGFGNKLNASYKDLVSKDWFKHYNTVLYKSELLVRSCYFANRGVETATVDLTNFQLLSSYNDELRGEENKGSYFQRINEIGATILKELHLSEELVGLSLYWQAKSDETIASDFYIESVPVLVSYFKRALETYEVADFEKVEDKKLIENVLKFFVKSVLNDFGKQYFLKSELGSMVYPLYTDLDVMEQFNLFSLTLDYDLWTKDQSVEKLKKMVDSFVIVNTNPELLNLLIREGHLSREEHYQEMKGYINHYSESEFVALLLNIQTVTKHLIKMLEDVLEQLLFCLQFEKELGAYHKQVEAEFWARLGQNGLAKNIDRLNQLADNELAYCRAFMRTDTDGAWAIFQGEKDHLENYNQLLVEQSGGNVELIDGSPELMKQSLAVYEKVRQNFARVIDPQNNELRERANEVFVETD